MHHPRVEHSGKHKQSTVDSYASVVLWTGVLLFSGYLYVAGRQIGGTMEWIGILHPVLFGITIWPVIKAYWTGRIWTTISNGVLGLIYVYMGLGSARYILRYDDISKFNLIWPERAFEGMVVVLVGTVAYRLGAEGPWFQKKQARSNLLPSTPEWTLPIKIGVIGGLLASIVLWFYMYSAGLIGWGSGPDRNYTQILILLSDVGMLALIAGVYYWMRDPSMSIIEMFVLLSGGCVLLLLALISGMKQEVIRIVLYVGVPYAVIRNWGYGKRKIGSLTKLGAVTCIIALFALMPVFRTEIASFGKTQNRVQASQMVLPQLNASIQEQGAGRLLVEGADQLWGRVSMFDYLLSAIAQTPERFDYKGWERYPYLIATPFIPRIVWPEKPRNTEGVEFTLKYIYDLPVSTTPSTFGWAYIEHGIPAVIVLFFVLGLIAQYTLCQTIKRHGLSLASIVVYTVMFQILFWIEADPFWVLNGIPKVLIATAVSYVLMVMAPQWILGR